MARITLPKKADLRGAAKLLTSATVGVTNVVEAVHARVARLPGTGTPGAPERTGGITGFVYNSVRGIARVAGGGVDGLLALVGPPDAAGVSSPQREGVIAAINGVLGDHLHATGNPLAITMQFRRAGQPLVLERAALAAAVPAATGQLLVLAHGLCMNDLQWRRNGHDHGAALARDLGFTPVYLHYNSGRHISSNAQAFAQQLELLVGQWPVPLERLVIVGHSMGGLLARSAVHHARAAGQRWPDRLDDLVCLGSPHHGAPLERAGNWLDLLLQATPYSAPFARLTQLRSDGIMDLRHGNLLDTDWGGRHRTEVRAHHRQPVPLPDSARCFLLAGTLASGGANLRGALLGDGLVPVASALGQHPDPAYALVTPEERRWIGTGMNHLDLLDRAEVHAKLREWLSPSAAPPPPPQSRGEGA